MSQSIQWLILMAISLFFLACGGADQESQTVRSAKKERDPMSIIRNDDCLGCHSIVDRTVGPAYIEVAARYEANPETIQRLANKIIEGGLWGGAQMSKHPFLKEKDAQNIVRWILSLDGPEARSAAQGSGYVLATLPESGPTAKGWQLEAWTEAQLGRFPAQGFPHPTTGSSAFLKRSVAVVHFQHSAAFAPLTSPFLLTIKGQMTIKKRGVYFFQLAKGGRAMMKWEGLQIISDRKDDLEINLKLEAGTYPVEIDYISTGGQDSLSLFWLPPGEKYFRLVPEEVLGS
jgi:cytochrome c551/c552